MRLIAASRPASAALRTAGYRSLAAHALCEPSSVEPALASAAAVKNSRRSMPFEPCPAMTDSLFSGGASILPRPDQGRQPGRMFLESRHECQHRQTWAVLRAIRALVIF